jgi:outer membrane protein assembly factor BamB
MKIPSRAISLVVLAALVGPAVSAQEWTRFRGPNGTGITAAKGIPVTWTEQDFVWRVPVAGEGHGHPVIWGDKIFLNVATDQGRTRSLVCLHKSDGRELWRKSFTMPPHRPGNKNSVSSNASPVVDGERVVALFVSKENFWVRAFDHAGKELWSRDLGGFQSQHGHGASPIIHENTVIVTNEQMGDSFVIALDVRTGEPVWTSPRKAMRGGTAYGTPVLHPRADGSLEMILASQGHGISALDPKTGKMFWEAPVYDKRVVASPVVAGDVVLGSCGSGAGSGNYLAAVKLGGTGDVSGTHLAYTLRRATPYVPTPLYRDGLAYLISDGGIATAIEASSGKEVWSERLRAEFFASPVMIENRIYVPSTKGEMLVLATGDKFELLARNPIGEGTHSTPCIDGGRLYVKTFTHLVCVGKK